MNLFFLYTKNYFRIKKKMDQTGEGKTLHFYCTVLLYRKNYSEYFDFMQSNQYAHGSFHNFTIKKTKQQNKQHKQQQNFSSLVKSHSIALSLLVARHLLSCFGTHYFLSFLEKKIFKPKWIRIKS